MRSPLHSACLVMMLLSVAPGKMEWVMLRPLPSILKHIFYQELPIHAAMVSLWAGNRMVDLGYSSFYVDSVFCSSGRMYYDYPFLSSWHSPGNSRTFSR